MGTGPVFSVAGARGAEERFGGTGAGTRGLLAAGFDGAFCGAFGGSFAGAGPVVFGDDGPGAGSLSVKSILIGLLGWARPELRVYTRKRIAP